jgi:hypothetical protein
MVNTNTLLLTENRVEGRDPTGVSSLVKLVYGIPDPAEGLNIIATSTAFHFVTAGTAGSVSGDYSTYYALSVQPYNVDANDGTGNMTLYAHNSTGNTSTNLFHFSGLNTTGAITATMNVTAVSAATVSTGTLTAGALAGAVVVNVAHGGTGATSFASAGRLVYFDGTELASGNVAGAGNVTVSLAGGVYTAAVTGVVPFINGGTGAS